MKRVGRIVIVILAFLLFSCFDTMNVLAKELVASKSYTNIFGDILGTIQVYDNGEIVIGYKYGLRRVDVLYCEKGENCDNNVYFIKNIMESNIDNTYKNESNELEKYSYKLKLDKESEYRVKVEAYFGTNSGYNGLENIQGSYTISSLQSVDTGEKYLKISSKSSNVGDERVDGVLQKLTEITNTAILPIIYIVTGLVLVIKGALLGVQIVKSADEPEVRAQKVRGLIWLVVGVAIVYAASSVVGVITGFFKNMF